LGVFTKAINNMSNVVKKKYCELVGRGIIAAMEKRMPLLDSGVPHGDPAQGRAYYGA